MSARGRAAGILFSRPRPGCGFFVFLPAAGTVGLSAQLAYKNSFPFRKHRNSRPPICVSDPFRAQKLVVAPGNRNWSRGGRDIDPRLRQTYKRGRPRPRRLEQRGRSRSQQTYKKGHAPLFFCPRPGCGFFVFLPAVGTVGLSAQLAY